MDTIDYANGDGMLSAPVLLTESSSDGYGVSGQISFASVGGSKSSQTTYTKVSAMDLNGDGYPDWISDSDGRVSAHLTKPAGTLGGERVSTSVPLPKSESDAWTIDAGVSLHKYMDEKQQAKADKASEAVAINIVPKFSSTSQGQNATNGNRTSAASVSASGNFSSGENSTPTYWSDFNGDGLPDMVTGSGIRYNLGYDFTDARRNYVDGIEKSHYSTWGAGFGTSINILGPAKITYGVNGTVTTSYSDVTFLDVNGDGLPDRLCKDDDDNISVGINTGTDFINGLPGDGTLSEELGKTRATSASVYGDFAVKIPVHILFLKFTLTPSVRHSESSGVSTVHSSLQDIDGDGLPDLVYSDDENSLQVRRNLTGRTNMLKSVELPFGGRINIGYGQTVPSFDMPGRRWVMTSVETTGGYEENGATSSKATFEYEGGYRDRRERDFYGFRTVRTNQHDTGDNDRLYRYSVQHYDNNRDYHAHGLLTGEELYDAEGRQLQGATYEYDLRKVSGEVRFPALTAVVQTSYDETTGAAMTTKVENDYDRYGNLTVCNETATDYELDADIEYHSLTDRYIVSVPKSITVKSAGTVYRQRSTEINGKGDITQIAFPLADGEGSGEALYNVTLMPGFSVHTAGMQVIINGIKSGSVYGVYNMQGKVISSGIALSDNLNVRVPTTGSYIVRVGSEMGRVNVK